MIDINELRRLAQAATPGPWIGCGPSFGESLPKYLNEVAVDREGDEDDGYSICNTPIGLDQECSDDMAFIAAANPAAITELLDRLEAAEAECLEQARLNGMGSERELALMAKLQAAEKERDGMRAENAALVDDMNLLRYNNTTLRAKVEQMERQEPAAWWGRGPRDGHLVCSVDKPAPSVMRDFNMSPIYALPGAQPAQSVPDSIIADAARYQFLRNGGAYLEPNEGEIYMATDYGAKYYKDLRDLDMDIDEALAAAPEAPIQRANGEEK